MRYDSKLKKRTCDNTYIQNGIRIREKKYKKIARQLIPRPGLRPKNSHGVLYFARFQLHLRNKYYKFKILDFAVIIKTKLYLLCDGLNCRNRPFVNIIYRGLYTLSRDDHLNLMFRIFFTHTVLLLLGLTFACLIVP
jgi:hypothetical protein